jgi:hypothetical protein
VIDGLGVQSILVKDFDELDKLEKLGEEFDSTFSILHTMNMSL